MSGHIDAQLLIPFANPPQPVHAELVGSHQCRAEGFTARSSSPIFAICRALIAAGVCPDRPLHAFRDGMLCIVVRSIAEGARLIVKDRASGPSSRNGCRFLAPRWRRPCVYLSGPVSGAPLGPRELRHDLRHRVGLRRRR